MITRNELARRTAGRGKYAPLFRHLSALGRRRWRVSFGELEAILGFRLPDSARIHRPWWANQSKGGHGHALAWQAAGWRTSAVDLAAEALVFEPLDDLPPQDDGPRAASLDLVFPPHDFGSWPEGFSARREDIYGAGGR